MEIVLSGNVLSEEDSFFVPEWVDDFGKELPGLDSGPVDADVVGDLVAHVEVLILDGVLDLYPVPGGGLPAFVELNLVVDFLVVCH